MKNHGAIGESMGFPENSENLHRWTGPRCGPTYNVWTSDDALLGSWRGPTA